MTPCSLDAALEFDAGKLDAFLQGCIPGLGALHGIERVSGGQSNPTFFVSYARRRLVLRKKPPGPTLPSAHAVDREARVLRALAGTAVPVPPVLVFHGEPDVVGTPFYIMDRIEGRVFGTAALDGAADRRAMYFSFAETLARLHDADWKRLGLEGFGRPGGYFARQLSRWGKQWQAGWFRDIPDLKRLETWLAANLPEDDGHATICHGDFRLGNIMFHSTEPHIVAVLDWELSTIGHPSADLGYSLIGWRSAPAEYGGILGLDWAGLGIPTEAEFLDRYYGARQTPAEPLMPFHVGFAMYRFAVIFEGIAARSRAGTAASADAAAVGDLSFAFARRGLEAVGLVG